MRMNLASLHGTLFLELGQDPLFQKCHTALVRISAGDQERCDRPLDQFTHFLTMRMEGTNILVLRKLKPTLVWAQVDNHDMRDLANVLVQVHSNPAGVVSGERNHKTNNRVRTKQRVRLGIGKC